MKSLRFVIIPAAFILLSACLGQWLKKPGPRVVLTWQEKVNRCAILIKDLDLNVIVDPPGPLPYSSNGSTAVWVGTQFPPEKIAEVIDIGKTYYGDLRYIALSDYGFTTPPESAHYEIYIGGKTESALKLGLKAWTDADFKKLKAAKTQKEIFALITSKYGPKPSK